jgi:hypothetical protein
MRISRKLDTSLRMKMNDKLVKQVEIFIDFGCAERKVCGKNIKYF